MVGGLGSDDVDYFLVAPGQSGRLQHSHFDSHVTYWASGQVIPLSWKDSQGTISQVMFKKSDVAQEKEL